MIIINLIKYDSIEREFRVFIARHFLSAIKNRSGFSHFVAFCKVKFLFALEQALERVHRMHYTVDSNLKRAKAR